MRRGVVRARLAVRAGLVVRTRDMVRARMAAAATTLLVAVALLALALAAAGCDMPSTGGLGQVIGSGKPVTKHLRRLRLHQGDRRQRLRGRR